MTTQTLREFFDTHFAPNRLTGVRPGTRTTYLAWLNILRDSLSREPLLTDLTDEQYARLAEWLKSQPYSDSTRKRVARFVRSVWAHAYELGLAGTPPNALRRGRPCRPKPVVVPRPAAPKPGLFAVASARITGAARSIRRTLRRGVTVDEFLERYIASRTDIKWTTRELMNNARAKLVTFFGPDKLLSTITPGDADEFRIFVMHELGDNTARRLCGRAKQYFRAAVRKGLIAESPFADMKGNSVRCNKERVFYISREMADRVMAACPDAHWRLLFALSRYGGLRCPSEHLVLTWADIDWERNRIRVWSPKTAHHFGKDQRWIPLFPELRPHLLEVHELAGRPVDGFVLTKHVGKPTTRRRGINMGTQFARIVAKAGLRRWPKLFQNLRSTRQTELADKYPIHVVCAWMGNSQVVAREHYLQLTDDYFEQAARDDVDVLTTASSQGGGA